MNAKPQQREIVTVGGPIPADQMGRSLVHEHIVCDFTGAQSEQKTYALEDVVQALEPHLLALRDRGYTGFVDCTPEYIGRDVHVLRVLSQRTGLHIVTNTGFYGAADDRFVPPRAFEQTAEQLASGWTEEWKHGIAGSGIFPGFVKTGVDPGPLSALDRKLVEAAALTHLQTGLTIACHTGEGTAALEVLQTAINMGVSPEALVVVHSDSIQDFDTHVRILEEGAWLEYDGISEKSVPKHVQLIQEAVERGFATRLLLSHDAGWYSVGEPGGGTIRPFTVLSDSLIPALTAGGISEETIDRILDDNVADALSVHVRRR